VLSVSFGTAARFLLCPNLHVVGQKNQEEVLLIRMNPQKVLMIRSVCSLSCFENSSLHKEEEDAIKGAEKICNCFNSYRQLCLRIIRV
jgi:hypothetical protein